MPEQTKRKGKATQRVVPWLYDLVLWALSVLIDLFFREVATRGAWRVPKSGPIILVAAPHANQVSSNSYDMIPTLTSCSLLILSSSCECSNPKRRDEFLS